MFENMVTYEECLSTPTMFVWKTVPINHMLSFCFDKHNLNFKTTLFKNYFFTRIPVSTE